MNKTLKTLLIGGAVTAAFFAPKSNFKTATAGLDFTVDSGFFTSLPSDRSAGVLGQNLNNAFSVRPKNTFAKIASYAVETVVATQYELCLHELGHANFFRNNGGIFLYWENGETNFFKYVLNHKLDANAESHGWRKNFTLASLAGFNATTQFIESNNVDLIWELPARLSTWTYATIKRKAGISYDTDGKAYSARDMRAAQLLALAGSFWGPKFYAYFNQDGISIRGVHTLGHYTVAVESLLNAKHYNAEVQVGRSFNIAGVTVTPKVTIGKSINVGGTVTYKNWTTGFSRVSEKTLSGARIAGANEVYIQYTIKL